MGYDINQLYVADSFQALYLDSRGRPTLAREQLQVRQELCEDLAQSLSEACLGLRFKSDATADDALAQVHTGLLMHPSSLPPPEARWVAIRTAELLQWEVPEFLACGPLPGSLWVTGPTGRPPSKRPLRATAESGALIDGCTR